MKISNEVKEQVLNIRETGITNMFDARTVQHIAMSMGYYALVNFIEDHKADYVNFILKGDE